MQIAVGPYRFSVNDARRTLIHADEFLDGFPAEAHQHQTARRARIADAIAGFDVGASGGADLVRPLENVWRELLSARDDVVAADALPATQVGTIAQLNTSGGGVPKLAVDRVEVGFGGVVGDRQATRRHHGSPFQALCLWHAESIDHLAAEGHPIAYGSAGENVTIGGIEWPTIRPGVRLRLGAVLCEISSHAVPCKQNARWFADRDVARIHQRNGPWSRMYATVIEPGTIAVRDPAIVEP